MNPLDNQGKDVYRIGAVSRLTGIPPDTIRVWERRYGIVAPARASGRFRMYSRDDVARLALVKQLVDAGNAISSVANLSIEQLQARLRTYSSHHSPAPAKCQAKLVRTIVIGEALPALLENKNLVEMGIELIGTYRDPVVDRDRLTRHDADVLVLEYPNVYDDTLTQINGLLKASGAQRAVVVYGFGNRRAIAQLQQPGLMGLRAPISLDEFRLAVTGAPNAMPAASTREPFVQGNIPRRAFDNAELVRLSNLSTTIKCECPNHTATLIMSLNAFESYSAECENRSPEDAALHMMLHTATAQARAIMEQALEKLLKAENIDV